MYSNVLIQDLSISTHRFECMNLRSCSACWSASHRGTWSSLFRSSNANLDAFNSSRKTWMLSESIARCRQLFPCTSFFFVSAPFSRINWATRHMPAIISGRSSAGLRPHNRCKGVSRATWVWWSSKQECLIRNVAECSSPRNERYLLTFWIFLDCFFSTSFDRQMQQSSILTIDMVDIGFVPN